MPRFQPLVRWAPERGHVSTQMDLEEGKGGKRKRARQRGRERDIRLGQEFGGNLEESRYQNKK